MCGRITLAGLSWPELHDWLNLRAEPERPIAARFNVPPTAEVPLVRSGPEGPVGDFARWGLVPAWHRGTLAEWRASTINARVEEVADKPSFRAALRGGRCVVLARGYFEWQVRADGKHPHFISPATNAPALLMAGLMTRVALPDFAGATCAILTEAVRAPLDQVHDRMPVLLTPEGMAAWLAGAAADAVGRLPMAGITWHEVAPAVGSVRNEGAHLIAPLVA